MIKSIQLSYKKWLNLSTTWFSCLCHLPNSTTPAVYREVISVVLCDYPISMSLTIQYQKMIRDKQQRDKTRMHNYNCSKAYTWEWHIPQKRRTKPSHEEDKAVVANTGSDSMLELSVRKTSGLHLRTNQLQRTYQRSCTHYTEKLRTNL